MRHLGVIHFIHFWSFYIAVTHTAEDHLVSLNSDSAGVLALEGKSIDLILLAFWNRLYLSQWANFRFQYVIIGDNSNILRFAFTARASLRIKSVAGLLILHRLIIVIMICLIFRDVLQLHIISPRSYSFSFSYAWILWVSQGTTRGLHLMDLGLQVSQRDIWMLNHLMNWRS